MINKVLIEHDYSKELQYQLVLSFIGETSKNIQVRFGKNIIMKDFANLLRDIAFSIDQGA